MDFAAYPPPRRSDDRIILHFDYDCFYAQVVQRRFPGGGLDGRCVGVTQKSLLATCNYEARRRGVRKMMRISEARRICPDMVLVDGEDLTPFRDASKQLYRLVRDAVGPAAPVERLGLDEVFVDATALVDANLDRFHSRPLDTPLSDELFLLSTESSDKPRGFPCDCTSFAGHVIGDSGEGSYVGAPNLGQGVSGVERHARTRMRLLLGSQLAAHLRLRLEHEAGYTSSAGIATSKVLSKLAGKVKKPAGQTVLVSAAVGGDAGGDGKDQLDLDLDAKADAVVWQFMDQLPLRSVPGIGFKTSSLLSAYILAAKEKAAAGRDGQIQTAGINGAGVDDAGQEEESGDESDDGAPTVMVEHVRTYPGMSPRLLDSILNGNNSTGTAAGNIPTGRRVWDLLHGVDDTPVRGGRDLPTQISIEDTWAGPRQGTLRPDAAAAVTAELRKLATSLVRRMHVDLVGPLPASGDTSASKGNATDADAPGASPVHNHALVWLARPRTLRLTLRPQLAEAVDNRAPENYFARMSRSQPLPGFMLSLTLPPAQIVDRLVGSSLVPMFRKLAASVQVGKRALVRGTGPAWTIGLLNVCVANMVPAAGQGSDIAAMFMRQDQAAYEGPGHELERERVKEDRNAISETRQNGCGGGTAGDGDREEDGWNTDEEVVDGTFEVCAQCGHPIAVFALAAHARFHALGE
ncbi:hypothetical protein SEPCBS119000_001757 [Sporothrix epigloea]|uniref:UmuC domain-containing protein n=1 Tax=Sporothrix epigloea TaxID=1892477 RepID=A0ABP0DDN8_9PEZI